MVKSRFGLGSFFSKAKETKAPTKKQTEKLFAKILAETKDMSAKDIKTWRDALESMDGENPKYTEYHDLIHYLSTDAHMQSQKQIRELATLSTPVQVIDTRTGKEIPERTAFLNSKWFRSFCKHSLEWVTSGYRVLELVDTDKMEFKLIPPRNVINTRREVLLDTTAEKGISLDAPDLQDYIVEVGEPEDIGIINNIVQDLIFKKNAKQSWAEYAEKFGMPIVVAKTNRSDDKHLNEIEQQIEDIGENLSAVLPEGTSLEIIANTNSDAYRVYDKKIERSNSEISKQYLGGTMVSDNGSSKSQSEVHERTLDNKIAESDRFFMEDLFNDCLLPLLRKWKGWGENEKIVYNRTRKIPLKDHWGIVKDALEKYEIEDSWVAETFKIPIKGRKKEVTNFNKPLPKEPKAEANGGFNFPFYEAVTNNMFTAESGSIFKKIEILQKQITEKIFRGEDCSEEVLTKAVAVGKWLRQGLYNGWGSKLEIDYNATDHKALAYMEYNLFHFSHAREMAGLQKLNSLLIDKDKLNIRSFSDFKDHAEPFLNKFNGNWLRTEYDFAIAVGQNASTFNKFLSEKDTVTRYVKYQTAGDSEVRAEHAILDGLIFDIDDMQARRLWPPNAWKCRCEFVQYLGKPKNIAKGSEAIKILEKELGDKQKKIMLHNRGDINKVFTFNQFYMSYKQKDFNKTINSLDFSNYNLKDYNDIKPDRAKIKLDKTITGDNVKELFKKAGTRKKGNGNVDIMAFKDHLNRTITIDRDVFDNHTKGHYLNDNEQRHQLFPHIKDVLKKPDEVYMTKHGRKTIQLRYIKMYGDRMMVIDSSIKNNTLEIQNWYNAKDKIAKGKKVADMNHVRKGLKID